MSVFFQFRAMPTHSLQAVVELHASSPLRTAWPACSSAGFNSFNPRADSAASIDSDCDTTSSSACFTAACDSRAVRTARAIPSQENRNADRRRGDRSSGSPPAAVRPSFPCPAAICASICSTACRALCSSFSTDPIHDSCSASDSIRGASRHNGSRIANAAMSARNCFRCE